MNDGGGGGRRGAGGGGRGAPVGVGEARPHKVLGLVLGRAGAVEPLQVPARRRSIVVIIIINDYIFYVRIIYFMIITSVR